MHSYIILYLYIFLGNSDNGCTGVIVGAVVAGMVGIISVAVNVLLSMILWHHCKMHRKENTLGNYIAIIVVHFNLLKEFSNTCSVLCWYAYS